MTDSRGPLHYPSPTLSLPACHRLCLDICLCLCLSNRLTLSLPLPFLCFCLCFFPLPLPLPLPPPLPLPLPLPLSLPLPLPLPPGNRPSPLSSGSQLALSHPAQLCGTTTGLVGGRRGGVSCRGGFSRERRPNRRPSVGSSHLRGSSAGAAATAAAAAAAVTGRPHSELHVAQRRRQQRRGTMRRRRAGRTEQLHLIPPDTALPSGWLPRTPRGAVQLLAQLPQSL